MWRSGWPGPGVGTPAGARPAGRGCRHGTGPTAPPRLRTPARPASSGLTDRVTRTHQRAAPAWPASSPPFYPTGQQQPFGRLWFPCSVRSAVSHARTLSTSALAFARRIDVAEGQERCPPTGLATLAYEQLRHVLEAGADIRWVRDQMGTPRSAKPKAPTGIWCARITSETWTRSTRPCGPPRRLEIAAGHRSAATLGIPPRSHTCHPTAVRKVVIEAVKN